jgi:hypothetical protein
MNQEPEQLKMGSIRRSWLITKSAWRIMMLDKEILWVPLISGLIGLIVAVAGYGGGYALSQHGNPISDFTSSTGVQTNHYSHTTYAIWLATSALLALISTYTAAAMISIGLKRLRGGDPTLGDGLRAVKKNFKSLTIFSLFSFGIIQVMQYLQQRLPFFGKILAYLGELAWRVAAFFAVPIIVDSNEDMGPIDASKRSINLIKQTWKESGANQFAMGTIFVFALLLEVMIGVAITVLTASAFGAFAAIPAILSLFAVILTVLISSAMDGIAKAVLYYYAVTGEAPATFDKRLLQEAFTAKKARRVFS